MFCFLHSISCFYAGVWVCTCISSSRASTQEQHSSIKGHAHLQSHWIMAKLFPHMVVVSIYTSINSQLRVPLAPDSHQQLKTQNLKTFANWPIRNSITLWCQWQLLQQKIIWLKMSIVPRLRSPALSLCWNSFGFHLLLNHFLIPIFQHRDAVNRLEKGRES